MIGKLDAWWAALRDLIGANPELMGVALVIFMAVGFVLMRVFPAKAETYKGWVRLSRYCHSCPHCDLHTETCAVGAEAGEKCGLIDRTAGMEFEVTKK